MLEKLAQGIIFFFLTHCYAPKQLPVSGRLGPYEVVTKVDSAAAKYYLEGYPGGKPDIDARVVSFGDYRSAAVLEQVAGEFSVDFAALYFGQGILRDNTLIQEDFLRNLAKVRQKRPGPIDLRYKILFVPGFDYVDYGHLTGADFAGQLALVKDLGFQASLVQIPSRGSVGESAAVLQQVLREETGPIILVGASSAGPAIHRVLGRDPAGVVAWLNIGGIVGGSRIVDWVTTGFAGWIFGLAVGKDLKERVTSLQVERLRPERAAIALPTDLVVVNYVGLALSGDISHFAWERYLFMRCYGPNDGAALLPDLLVPGETILAVSSDHFFAEDPLIAEKTLAILYTVLERLQS